MSVLMLSSLQAPHPALSRPVLHCETVSVAIPSGTIGRGFSLLSRSTVVIGLFVVLFFLPIANLHAAGCEVEKDRVSAILREGVSRMRLRLMEVSSMDVSEDKKAEFKTQIEWVSAWTEDVIRRLTPDMAEKEEGVQCEEIAPLIANIRAQWTPLELLSRRLYASRVRSHIERLRLDDDDLPAAFADAETILTQVGDATTLDASRLLLHKAIFYLRIGFRALRNAASMGGA